MTFVLCIKDIAVYMYSCVSTTCRLYFFAHSICQMALTAAAAAALNKSDHPMRSGDASKADS